MKVTDALDVCKTIDYAIDDISDGIFKDIKLKDNTHGVAKMADDHFRTDLTKNLSGQPERPNDPDCNSVNYRIVYDIPDCDPKGLECDTVNFNCDTTDSKYQNKGAESPTIDRCVANEMSITADDFCLNRHEMSVETIKAMKRFADDLYFDYNAALIDQLITMPGAFFGETTSSLVTPRPLKLFTPDATGRVMPQPIGILDAEKEYGKQTASYRGDHVTVTGSHYFRALQRSLNLYQGNVDGYDVSKVEMGDIYYDPRLANALTGTGLPGADSAITFLPGTIHLLEHYMFQGDREVLPNGRISYMPIPTTTDGSMRRQVVDLAPFITGRASDTPFYVDLQVHVGVCNSISPTVTLKAKKIFGLWMFGADAFCGDYNFVLAWQMACLPYLCTDVAC